VPQRRPPRSIGIIGAGFNGAHEPLLKQMLGTGLARADALRLGLDVSVAGALVDRGGSAASDLFALGPITKGAFWEIVAVPDLRLACEAMAKRLIPARRKSLSPSERSGA
jgi:uncharacterized NAD(P)/FAD-binding protein YdhS